jgi:hypothetical protein
MAHCPAPEVHGPTQRVPPEPGGTGVPAPSRALVSDLRLEAFAILFAVGTLFHELEFAWEVAAVGPITEYMERWGRAFPTTGWPSSVGLSLHLADVAVSLYLLVGRRRREGLCLLAVAFLLSQLVTPNRISSHSSLMFGGLLIVLILAAGEWIERATGWARSRPPAEWYAWTLRGLASICALTYFFAFFYKLNSAWFSARSPGPIFLIGPLGPILDRIVPPPVSHPILTALAIYGTLVIELGLPLALFHPRTRRLGMLIGAVFHFPMLLRGVTDFPVLTLAFYPAFLGLDEARDLLRRLARPRLGPLLGALPIGGFGIWAVHRAPQALGMSRGLRAIHPVIALVNTALTCAAIALCAYLIVALAGWLVAQRGDERLPRVVPLRRATAPAALVLFVVCLCAANQLAPYVGLPRAGALIMYSSVAPDMRNHFFWSGIWLTDAFRYAAIARFEAAGIDTREAREFAAFVRESQRQPHRVHLNVIRYHVNRICRSAAGGVISLTLHLPGRPQREFRDVCAEPAMRWYIPVPIGAECEPRCRSLRAWARGRMVAD